MDDVDEKKVVSKKYKEVWVGIEKYIGTINGGEKVEYSKDFKKIKFESDDDLPMNKPVKLYLLTIIIRSVFSEDGKFYPQLFLDDALYDVWKCNTKKLLMMKELITIEIEILKDFVMFVSFAFL